MELKTIGVVGAGVMGIGVSQALAQAGLSVVLVDRTEEILAKARGEITKALRFGRMMQKGSGGTTAEILGRIRFTTEVSELALADFVIENITENWAMKEKVYHAIDPICRPECVFAANTSAISITKIGSATKRADKVLGMHFMNPVPLKPCVEVIRGHHTSEQTLDTAQALLRLMGKEGIVVNDFPGFVSNRVLMLTINEAIFLVQDQVANATDVDRIFKTCFSHKMGPLETGDLIGLDTILDSLVVLYESYNDPKFRPAPLLRKMVDAGLLGRKSGKGFYTYE